MALETWNVDSDYVNKYIVQYRLSTNSKGGDLSEMINQAAADTSKALRMGGYTPSEITENDYPEAYLQVRRCVAVRAAFYYSMGLHNQAKSTKHDKLEAYSDKLLKEIAEDPYLGDIERPSGSTTSVYRHGDDTNEEMKESKIKWDYVP